MKQITKLARKIAISDMLSPIWLNCARHLKDLVGFFVLLDGVAEHITFDNEYVTLVYVVTYTVFGDNVSIELDTDVSAVR
jgi:hypothetical protein